MGFSGSLAISQNDLTLTSAGGVPGAFGLFLYGPEADSTPFGDGTLCVGPGSAGLFYLFPPELTEPDGTLALPLDLAAPPLGSGPGKLTPGSSWNFQCIYRDPAGPGGTGFNLSDAISFVFCP